MSIRVLCSKLLIRFDLTNYKKFSPRGFFNGRTLKSMGFMKKKVSKEEGDSRGVLGVLLGTHKGTKP